MRRRTLAAIIAAIAGCAGLSACGSNNDSGSTSTGASSSSASVKWPATTVDLGGGQTIHYKAGDPLRVVFFNFGSGYVYTDAIRAGAAEEAKKLGIQMDVLDAQSDPTKQVQQMQDASQSGKYGGGFVLPIVEDLICNLATKQLPSRGMMVVNTNAPLCGRRQNDGEAAWAPGSLAFVGGTQWVSTLKTWGDEIQRRNPGPQKVIVLVGPKGNAQSENASTALKEVQKEHPEFQVLTTVYTNFSTPDAQKKMQDALQANPDTTVVASIYSETTKGTVVALKQAGKLGKVKIYDVGADSTVIPLIEQGLVDMTFPYYPKSMGRSAIDALYNARMGKPYKKVYANDGHDPEALRKPGAPLLFVDKSNVKAWKSSGLSEY